MARKLLSKWGVYPLRAVMGMRVISMLALISAVVIILTEVIGRMFGKPIFVLEEICGAAFLVFIFAAIGADFVEEKHLRVAMIITRLPDKAREVLEFSLGILGLGFCVYATILWWHMTYVAFKVGAAFMTTGYPIWPAQLIALLGWIALIIAVIWFIVQKANIIFKSPRNQ